MKLTVCFGEVRVVVPCGDGDFAVNVLMQRAVDRYKKATGKLSECDVLVHALKNQRDGGILDPDDLLVDVVDDREQVFAEFVELAGDGKHTQDSTDALRINLDEITPGRERNDRLETLVAERRDEIRNGSHCPAESGESGSEPEEQAEEEVSSSVVVTERDLDAGIKKSQLTVRRESEPCKAAVDIAVNLTPSLETRNASQLRAFHASKLQVPESASAPRPLSPTESVSSTRSDDTSDGSSDRTDDSLPSDHGSSLQSAEIVPPVGTAKPAAVSRLLNGFVRSHVRQSLGSRNGPDWAAAQQRVEQRSASSNLSTATADDGASMQKCILSSQASPAVNMVEKSRDAALPTDICDAGQSAITKGGEVTTAPRPFIDECTPVGPAEQEQEPQRQVQHQLQNAANSDHARHARTTESATAGTREDRLHDAGDPNKSVAAAAEHNGSHVLVMINGSTEPLGLHVAGYFQNGREAGLAVHHLESHGRIEREGQIAVGDIIQQVNGRSLLGVPLDKAKAILREAINSGKAALKVLKCRSGEASGSSSSCNPSSPPKSPDSIVLKDRRAAGAAAATAALAPAAPAATAARQPPLPPVRSPFTRLSGEAAEPAAVQERHIGPPRPIGFDEVTVDLVKGAEGLGFTISSREHLAIFNEGVPPVYVKTIMPFGAAVADGRIKCGDRLMSVNGTDVSLKTQDDIVSLLRSTKQGSVVSIRLLRPQLLLDVPSPPQAGVRTSLGSSPGSPADPMYENVLVKAADPLVEYGDRMTFDIAMSADMPGTLGISLKGETAMTALGVHDLGIFVKDVVKGSAAHLDGRILPGDLLVDVNGTSLQGISNAAAMSVFRRAASEGRNNWKVTVARRRQPAAEDQAKTERAAVSAAAKPSSRVAAEVTTAAAKALTTPGTGVRLEPDDGSSHQSGIDPTEITATVPPVIKTADSRGNEKLSASPGAVVNARRPEPGLDQTPSAITPSPSSFLSHESLSSLLPTSGVRPTTLSLAGSYLSHPLPAHRSPPAEKSSGKLTVDCRSAEASLVAAAAARPRPVPRKVSVSATAQVKPYCNASTSPLRCSADEEDDDCSPVKMPRPRDRISYDAVVANTESAEERILSATMPILRSSTDFSMLPLSDNNGQRSAVELLATGESDVSYDVILPAARGFLNDSAVVNDVTDAAVAAERRTTESVTGHSPSQVEKVDAAIQCEAAAVTSTGSLGGRGKWDQRFQRDRSVGGVGLRRSTPRSQVSDAEKKERRKSELIQSSPYPGLVTTLAAAAAAASTATAASSPSSISSPLHEDHKVTGKVMANTIDVGNRDGGDRTKGPSEAHSSQPPAVGSGGGGRENRPGEPAVGKFADTVFAADFASLENRQPQTQLHSERRKQSSVAHDRRSDARQPSSDDRGPGPSSSVYASISPVSQWVEHTLEHSRAQPSARLLVAGRRPTPSRSPTIDEAAAATALDPTDWLSWDDDEDDSDQLETDRPLRKSPRKGRLQQECRRTAPRSSRPLERRRAQSVESFDDSEGSSSEALQPPLPPVTTTRSRSHFSSLDSLKAELRVPYDVFDDQPPSRARRRVTRACNESFRAAVDHSYDAPELQLSLPVHSATMETARGYKFDEVHDSGINPLSSSSSSDNYAEIDKKSPKPTPPIDSEKRSKKDKAKSSSFFGHLFRFGKSRKSLEAPAKAQAAKVGSQGRGSDLTDGRPQFTSSGRTAAQPRLQRNAQQTGSWSYHSHAKVATATAVSPSMMNEYYLRLVEEQRLQMVLASAMPADETATSAARDREHVYVNVAKSSSRDPHRASESIHKHDAGIARAPPDSSEPLYAKMKKIQKSEPNLSKHPDMPSAAGPWGRDRGLWSDRIYRLSEKDLTSDIREVSHARGNRHHQTNEQLRGVSKQGRKKNTEAAMTASTSVRRPLCLHDNSDSFLIAAHRRVTAANDYDLPSGLGGTGSVVSNMAAKRTRPHADDAAPSSEAVPPARPSAAAGAARSQAVSRAGSNGRQSHRLSLCYDYSDSSSDGYSSVHQVAASHHHVYAAGSRNSRRATELARV